MVVLLARFDLFRHGFSAHANLTFCARERGSVRVFFFCLVFFLICVISREGPGQCVDLQHGQSIRKEETE